MLKKFIAFNIATAAAFFSINAGATVSNDQTSDSQGRAAMLGLWTQACTATNVAWETVGVGSARTKMMFANDTLKTINLYSDKNCSNLIAQTIYVADTEIGPRTAAEGANWINLHYKNVFLRVVDQTVVDHLNSSIVPLCGSKSWELNQAKDISSVLEAPEAVVTCPFAKLSTVYDIALTDGLTLRFGLRDVGHDGSTEEARPLAINRDPSATFHRE